MRKGINDRMIEKQVIIQQRAIAKIEQILKGEQPFASIELDADTRIQALNGLGYEDMRDLVNEFGEAQMNKLLYETKKIEQRRAI